MRFDGADSGLPVLTSSRVSVQRLKETIERSTEILTTALTRLAIDVAAALAYHSWRC